MARVIGIDPGTVTIDVCGLDDGRVFLDSALTTAEALATPSPLLQMIESAGPLDLVAGPSGYGLPLTAARDLTDRDFQLAYLAAPGESGGIGGLRTLMRALAGCDAPVMLTPGVIHLPSVPAHRKINRVDMGTADKVCAAALAIHETHANGGTGPFILLELGGAFTAALAIDSGRIVDGAGGSAGAMGLRAAGALDGEVAFLAGTVTKNMLFGGGAYDVAGTREISVESLAQRGTSRQQMAWDAYIESAAKAIAAMQVSVPDARTVVLSGRVAAVPGVIDELRARLPPSLQAAAVVRLSGFASVGKHAAQGAAILADGLAGGKFASIVDTMGIRDARGSVLDHLFVIDADRARARLGLG